MNRLAFFLWASTVAFGQGSPDVVISQVYGGGGNAGAPLRNDFLELFNRGNVAVNVSGWSVQYASAAGTEWQVTPLTGTVEPRRYYLVQQAAGANTAATALPTPDATGTIAMSGTAAKVALVRTATPLAGASPAGGDLVDLVGYGTANASEGSPAPGLSNTTAALRRGNGCIDTDNNAADFQAGAPLPRNSQTTALAGCNEAPPDPTLMTISAIQGSGAESTVAGQAVSTRGIVTGRKSNGFFLQSAPEDQDTNPSTSEGIFVFTSSAPPAAAAVGSLVQVTGTVTEFRPAADIGSPPLTEIVDPSVQAISAGRPLPPAISLSAVADLETLEGMRVEAPPLTVVGPTGGTVAEPTATATSNGIFYAVEPNAVRPFTSPSGTLGGRLLRVDSRSLGRPALDVRSGDTANSVAGPLDFAFRTYTIASEGSILVTSPNRAEKFVPRGPGEFAVASMNIERLFDTVDAPGTSDPILTTEAYQRRLVRTGRVIRETLGSPEIIGVVEVESLPVLQALAAEAGNYESYLLEGNDIGGIDVGVLVRRDRVTVQSFTQEGKDTQVNGDLLNDRPPVILRATVDSLPVVVIVNHLRSLINADSPVVAEKRRNQAEFLAGLLQRERAENVISVGDYNMIQYDPLMQIITGSGAFLNLNHTLRPNEAYTYVFDGVTQALDHVVVSPSALAHLTRYQIAHVNADYPQTLRNNAGGANRISDHDIPVAYFSAAPPAFRFSAIGNSANYTSGSVAPSEWITIFTPGPVSQVLAGGTPAPIMFSSPTQTTVALTNVPVPGRNLLNPPGTLTLAIGASTVMAPLSTTAPGVFTLTATGAGQGAILNQDLSVNGAGNAAPRGSIVAIYGTGISGSTSVWIGSTRAEVTYSGVAPGLPAGINQVNARIPADAPVGGAVPLLIAAGDEVSAVGVTIAIR